MILPSLPVMLALVACVVGGVRGGLLLAAALWPEKPDSADAPPQVREASLDAKAMAGAVLVAHAATAAVLGYSVGLGQGMTLALGLAWIGAAAVRFWSARRLGARADGAVVELMMGVLLALPVWSSMARLATGAVI